MDGQFSVQAKSARLFLKSGNDGVLSTVSLDLPGYPFGSVTPYVLDKQCRPVILVSDLAQHTKNMDADNRVSLTVTSGNADSQANARLTYVGNARKMTSEEADVKARYLRRFPQAVHYFEAHNFYFYVIELVRARYIEGFGKIFWVDEKDLLLENIFTEEAEAPILDHMNQDHKGALSTYCRHFNLDAAEEEYSMTGIDGEGFDISAGAQRMRINFTECLTDPSQARDVLVALARESE
jgi:heme iron utilization protein